MTTEEFKKTQRDFWSSESSKYLALFVTKRIPGCPQEELDLYTYAMRYCQEQLIKYY